MNSIMSHNLWQSCTCENRNRSLWLSVNNAYTLKYHWTSTYFYHMESPLVAAMLSRRKYLHRILMVLYGLSYRPGAKSYHMNHMIWCIWYDAYPIPNAPTKLRILHIVTYIHYYIWLSNGLKIKLWHFMLNFASIITVKSQSTSLK